LLQKTWDLPALHFTGEWKNMIYKNFRLQVIARIMLIAVFLVLAFIAYRYENYIGIAVIIVILVFLTFSVIRYVERTNRDLANFLESIRFEEFNRHFRTEGMGASFDELSDAFNHVIRDFQRIRSEKEEQYHYLQNIVQNIEVSIIAYLPDGTVELINKSAKKLFQVSNLKNLKALEPLSHELVNTFLQIKPGNNYLVKVQDEDDILQLAITASELKIRDKVIIIATISNIQNVLEGQETEAWQKLIRVLTHEIMNSIAPISSLSATVEQMLNKVESKNCETGLVTMTCEDVEEIKQALQTINKRSNGLLHFVNTYRNLTRIPKPNFKVTRVTDLLKNIQLLMGEEFKKNKIIYNVKVEPENLEIYADEQLIEQVLINLVKNSVNAIEGLEKGEITIKGFYNKRGRVTVQVIDNGKGILKDVIDKIFIPFFTTKPSGSGIGLSLSKQILRLHNGAITAHSEPEKETVFTLTF
jgi:two-component system, NtrC family, nitrogen regulation sensor histidine kinase NtrY